MQTALAMPSEEKEVAAVRVRRSPWLGALIKAHFQVEQAKNIVKVLDHMHRHHGAEWSVPKTKEQKKKEWCQEMKICRYDYATMTESSRIERCDRASYCGCPCPFSIIDIRKDF